MKLQRKLVYLLVMLLYTTAAAEGATCAPIVQQAMSQVQQDCASTGRNQACYGYVSLDATPREGVQNFTFAKQGDLANVGDLDTLRLSALDTAKNTWGIALMKLQANLPDTLPGQNVTFLLFGDVQIHNAVAASPQQATVPITANGGANIRNRPSTGGSVVGSLAKGDTTTANGRNADGSWLRIQIPDSDSLGWVFASLVAPASDVSALSVVDTTQQETPFTPMQAFYFQTGITQTSCAEAPQDGILIQTPKGAGQINLRANDVDIQLGSTAFLQAQPGANMTVSVVEGEGHVTSGGKTVVVPAGSQATIPIDANLKASGAPSDPQPYQETLVQPLPVQVLPDQITVAAPASEAQIQEANAAPTAVPRASTGGLPGGFTGDLAGLNGLSGAAFCTAFNQILSQQGMSKAQYVQEIQTATAYAGAYIPAAQKAQFDQFIALLNACP